MSKDLYPLEPLFARVLTPFERFLRRTTAGGIVLVATTAIALALASYFGEKNVHDFWSGHLSIAAAGGFHLHLTWHEWINDGLMALFFLLVGLELKREILVGELSSLREAALPIVAAVGGMIVPASIFTAFNIGAPGAHGWGIPMATDIAFAVGILVLLAWRVPKNLIIFLTALAIADDLGAVLVIAVFYTASIDLHALSWAAFLLFTLLLFNRGGLRNPLPYAIVGVLLWYALLTSGVHATVAGILLAAMIPARPSYSPAEFERRIHELQAAFAADQRDASTPDDPLGNEAMATISEAVERSAVAVQSPLQRMEHSLTPWVTFAVIPLFALANAGVDVGNVAWREVLTSDITVGVLLALVIGKFTGITAFSWVAVKIGFARLPSGVRWAHLAGGAWLAGIGFTMSLFIASEAFRAPDDFAAAKVAIFGASILSAILGAAILWNADRSRIKMANALNDVA
jgi:Na+:H+ antiporter, NhaA family